jgi:hypothetical protein
MIETWIQVRQWTDLISEVSLELRLRNWLAYRIDSAVDSRRAFQVYRPTDLRK